MFLEKFTIMSICPMGKSSTNFIDVGQVQQCYKYNLVNYHECFIKIKTRVAAKCFRLEKTRTATLLKGFKHFYCRSVYSSNKL